MKNLISITMSMTLIAAFALSGCDSGTKSRDTVNTATVPIAPGDVPTEGDNGSESEIQQDQALTPVEIQSVNLKGVARVFSQIKEGKTYYVMAPLALHPAKPRAIPLVEAYRFKKRRRVERITLHAAFQSQMPEATFDSLAEKIQNELGIEELQPAELDLENSKIFFDGEELDAKRAFVADNGEIRINLKAVKRRKRISKHFRPLKDVVKGMYNKRYEVKSKGFMLQSQFEFNGELMNYEIPLSFECIKINSTGWATIDKRQSKCTDIYE